MFKKKFLTKPRATLSQKVDSAHVAYREVSSDVLRAFFQGCGLVTTETLEQVSERLELKVKGKFTAKHIDTLCFYRKWVCGRRDIENSPPIWSRCRAVEKCLNDSGLTGRFWNGLDQE